MNAILINPQPLQATLRLILTHAAPLVTAAIEALFHDRSAATRLYARMTRLVTLTILLLRRLPELTATATALAPPSRRKRPGQRAKPLESPGPPEPRERAPSLGNRSVPAIVAQICRELGHVARILNQDARDQLTALAAKAKADAAAWTQTPEALIPEALIPEAQPPTIQAPPNTPPPPTSIDKNTEAPTPAPPPLPKREQSSS